MATQSRDYKDIISGAVVLLFGAYVLGYAWTRLDIGTLTQMGPGMFPAGAGALLVAFGAAIALPAFRRTGTLTMPDWRSAAIIVAAMVAFGITLPLFGIIPALVLLTNISLFAGRPETRSLLTSVLLTVFVCAFVILVFRVGLGLRFELIGWAL